MKKMITMLLAMFLVISVNAQTTGTSASSGLSGSGTVNYIPKFTAAKKVGNSVLFQNSNSEIGINRTALNSTFEIKQVVANAFMMRLFDINNNEKFTFYVDGHALFNSYLSVGGVQTTGYTYLRYGTNVLQTGDSRPLLNFQNSTGSYPFLLGIKNDSEIGLATSTGWAWYVDNVSKDMFVNGLKIFGQLNVQGIPTSPSGLPSGTIWNNNGVLNIVP